MTKNRPYRTVYYDIKGPIHVNDDRKFKKVKKKQNEDDDDEEDQTLKAYILTASCALTRHVTLEVTEDRSYEAIKLAILRLFYERGTCRIMISDMESAFKAIEKDLSEKDSKDTKDMIEGWKSSEQKIDLETSYGTQFIFQQPETPQYNGLVERMHRTISQSMLTLKQANLRLSQFTTIVKGLQAMLNKRPLGGMNNEVTDEIEFVTPSMLLTGYDINVCPNYTLPKVEKRMIQSRSDIIAYSKHMKALYSRIWGKFILSYVENLNNYKRKNQTTPKIKIGDYVIYSGLNKEMSPINRFQICKVLKVLKGRNGDDEIRSLKVQMIKGGSIKEFTRNIRRFCLLELDVVRDNENDSPPTKITPN